MLNIFTIVQNGMPFIRNQIKLAEKLTIPYRWVFVEGPADPVNDTSWCNPFPKEYVGKSKDGSLVSVDGTHEALDNAVASKANIILITKATPWAGKTAMCNAALEVLDPGPLMQIDVDEFWTAQQMVDIHECLMPFTEVKKPITLRFDCRYWITDLHETVTPGNYGHYPYEWFRAWSRPTKSYFSTHEPPILDDGSRMVDCSGRKDLIFEHYAYTNEAAVAFKEKYYGYAGAVEKWQRMRKHADCGLVRDWLPWVRDDARFIKVGSVPVRPARD